MTKTIRILFFLATLLGFFFAVPILYGQSIPIKIIETVKSGVIPFVCLEVRNEKPAKIKLIAGSGFFINANGDFVTARHVITELKAYSEKELCEWAVFLPDAGWAKRLPKFDVSHFLVKECTFNQQSDVGVCKLRENPFSDAKFGKQIGFLRFVRTQFLKDGVPVAFTGFPLQNRRPVTSLGHLASLSLTDDVVLIDKSAWPGASGGPVYTADGGVLGVLILRGTNDGAGLAYALPSETVIKFLAKNKIAFHQKLATTQKKQSRRESTN